MSSSKKKTMVIGFSVIGGLTIAAVAAMAIAIKKITADTDKPTETTEKYSFYAGKDYSWMGADDSVQIASYVSDQTIFDTCDGLRTAGKGCAVAVRYGNNVYYRPNVASTPYDWKGKSPSPSTDGSWVFNK